MSDNVSVDLVELRYGGHRLGGWHVESSGTFDGGFRQLAEAAETGWVGASAKALAEKLETLQASAQSVTARLGQHGAGFISAANTYEAQDAEAAAVLNPREAVSPRIHDEGDGHRPLNL